MTQSWKMLRDSEIKPEAKAGTIVYKFQGYDYGLARDDARFSGIPHISCAMTDNASEGFFTVPVTILGHPDDELLGPDPVHPSGKPFKGRLEEWSMHPYAKVASDTGLGFVIFGHHKGHPDMGIRTSYVVSLDKATGFCETKNSFYLLIGPEQV